MSNRRLRVVLCAAVLLGGAAISSCGESTRPLEPSSPEAQAPASDPRLFGLEGLLVSCSPQPFDSVTVVIGPAGGVLQVGAHSFTVPQGALDSNVAITAVTPTGNQNIVRFQPEGLVFNKKASLTMSYANCNLLAFLLPKRIAHTNAVLDILEYLSSTDNLLARRVTGKLRHFSDYAVAW